MLFKEMKVNKKKTIVAAICLMIVVVFCVQGFCRGKVKADRATLKQEVQKEQIQKSAASAEKAKRKFVLDMGEMMQLPLAEEESIVSCKSSNEKVVSVLENGYIHAQKQGKAKITLETKKTGDLEKKVFHFTVKKRGMVYPVYSMMKGEHLDLQFSLKQPVKVHSWKSKNTSVAKVSKNGKITAYKKGHTVITGKAENGKVYRCKLTVTKKLKNVIYLTFDDGPNRYSTTKILNILKKHNVKATFFELKPAKADFDLTKRVVEEGHSLALHGYQHKYNIIYRSQNIYHNNLDQLRNLFFRKYGVWCTVSRFPGGSSNTVSRYNPGIMTKLTQKLDGWGYHYFDWNADSCDAGGARNANDVFRNVKNSLYKGRSNVVLMHDYADNDKTIHALEKIIQYGKENGYTFLPITASTTEVHHAVNN